MEVRHPETGPYLVRLAMNAGDVGLEDHGVLMDPLVLPRDPGSGEAAGAVAVHLMGDLCLEADLITRRTVFLPRLPRPGDLLSFVNTAGYCVDFGATHAQQQPVARKVAVHRQDGRSQDGPWRWCLDEEYWPLDRTGLRRDEVRHHHRRHRRHAAGPYRPGRPRPARHRPLRRTGDAQSLRLAEGPGRVEHDPPGHRRSQGARRDDRGAVQRQHRQGPRPHRRPARTAVQERHQPDARTGDQGPAPAARRRDRGTAHRLRQVVGPEVPICLDAAQSVGHVPVSVA